MCRDELLLKSAILGLVSLDATPQHMATLLQCYKGVGGHLSWRVVCGGCGSGGSGPGLTKEEAELVLAPGPVHIHRARRGSWSVQPGWASAAAAIPAPLSAADQPNIHRDKTDAVLAILQQTRQQEKR